MFYRKRFDELERQLDKIEVYLIVNDPNTPNSAETYDGLRKVLQQAYKGTQSHMAHLALLHRAASAANSLDPVLAKLREFMDQTGIVEVDDAASINFALSHLLLTDLFDLTGRDGENLVVDESAYITESENGVPRVISRGSAHFESNSTRELVAGSSADISPAPETEDLATGARAEIDDDDVERSQTSMEGESS